MGTMIAVAQAVMAVHPMRRMPVSSSQVVEVVEVGQVAFLAEVAYAVVIWIDDDQRVVVVLSSPFDNMPMGGSSSMR